MLERVPTKRVREYLNRVLVTVPTKGVRECL